MDSDLYNKQKQIAAEFWKSYFAKFHRRIEAHEVSETSPGALTGDRPSLLPFPDRRMGRRRGPNLRSS